LASVLASTKIQSAQGPNVVQTFCPLRTKSSAVEPSAGLQRRQIASRAGLAETLAPDLVRRQHRRQEAAALLFAAVMDQRRAAKPDAEEVQDRRRVDARRLGLEDRLLDAGRAPSAPFGGQSMPR